MAYEGGLTEQRDIVTFQARAGATINPYRIVMKGTDPDEVIQSTGGTNTPLGISGDASEANADTYSENDPVAVRYGGIVYLSMSGVGVHGDRVMSNATGQGIRHVNTDGVWVIGIALQAWTDGQVIPVLIDRMFVGDYTSS